MLTHSDYPPSFEEIEPTVETNPDATEYEKRTAEVLRKLFRDRIDADQPERSAFTATKRRAVGAANTIIEYTDTHTLDEAMALVRDDGSEIVRMRNGTGMVVTPEAVAVAAYATQVHSLEWGSSEIGDDWSSDLFVLLHDNLHKLVGYTPD